MREPTVQEVMTNLVVTFRLDEPVREAAQRMLANRISGGPVVERGRVVGVISESDIARALVPRERLDTRAIPTSAALYFTRSGSGTAGVLGEGNHSTNGHEPEPRVGEWMSTAVVTVAPTDGLWSAARLLERHGIKRLPVVDDEGYLVGILARADIVRAVTEEGSEVQA